MESTLRASTDLVLHCPLAQVDRVVRVLRCPTVGGPEVGGLEPDHKNNS